MCVFKNHAFIYFLRPPSWSGTILIFHYYPCCHFLFIFILIKLFSELTMSLSLRPMPPFLFCFNPWFVVRRVIHCAIGPGCFNPWLYCGHYDHAATSILVLSLSYCFHNDPCYNFYTVYLILSLCFLMTYAATSVLFTSPSYCFQYYPCCNSFSLFVLIRQWKIFRRYPTFCVLIRYQRNEYRTKDLFFLYRTKDLFSYIELKTSFSYIGLDT